MKKSMLLVISFLCALSAPAHAVVKLSKSGLCHTSESRYYEKLKSYVEHKSLEACISAGGRPVSP